MKISVMLQNNSRKGEFLGEVTECDEKEVIARIDDEEIALVDKKDKHVLCQLRIVVDNVLYCWEDIEIHPDKQGEKGIYRMVILTNPKVYNRRKYPRMPLSNRCTITMRGTEEKFQAKMVNISANGFAFAVRDEYFANCKGKDLSLTIIDFPVLDGASLTGHIIRSSNNEGEYVVGCRMPQDSECIREYVSKNYSE